ncbi:MAG: DsbC family protein [Pseudomonadota bacterium]
MRFPHFAALLSSVAMAFVLSLPAPVQAQPEADIRASLLKHMGVEATDIRKLPFADLYEVLVNGQTIAYTDAKGEVVLVGNLLDVRTRANLTEQRQKELLSVDWKSLPLDRAVVYRKGDGSRRMAVFSDPDCPFCRKLEGEIAGLDNLTVYTFLLPIRELHPDAARKAHAVWCAKDRGRAWLDLMLLEREPEPAAAGCTAPLEEIAALAKRMRINGTPGLVFESGRVVPGLINRVQIEQNLQQK